MAKGKSNAEDDLDDDYRDGECPECGAIIKARFQRGRRWRRLQCPTCRKTVRVTPLDESDSPPLIQLHGKVK